MYGLEKVYDELDRIRNRVARLVIMDRLSPVTGARINGPIVRLLTYVNDKIEGGEDGEEPK